MSYSYEKHLQRKRHETQLRELLHWCRMTIIVVGSLGTLAALGGVIWRAWS